MARSSEQVMVLLPGPQWLADDWGDQWTEPGVTSPGTVLARGEASEVFEDGTATVTIGQITRRIAEGTGVHQYQRDGIPHTKIRQARNALAPYLTDADPGVRKIVEAMRASVTGQDRGAIVDDLLAVLAGPFTSAERRLAAQVLYTMLAFERGRL